MRCLLVCALLAAPLFAGDLDPVLVPAVLDLQNKKDPVTGAKVALGKEIHFKGVRIHFATGENGKKFLAAPQKHVGKLGLALGKEGLDLQNKTCPVTGGKVDGKEFADLGLGWRVRVSGKKARAALRKDAAKHLKTLGYVYVPAVIDLRNKGCPITGDRCYPEAPIWVEHDGIRVRVCCDHCIEEFEADPKRCFQALMVDPKKLKQKYGGQ